MRDKVNESGVPDTVRRAAADVGSEVLESEGLAGEREARIRRYVDDYPLVSTGGKGAVVFRYDHGLNNFRDVLLPLHGQYGLPSYVAMNSRNWEFAQSDLVTPAEASTWEGVEWGNHTTDHQDKTGRDAIWESVVDGRTELEGQLGRTIHGFTVPGVSGLQRFDGFGSGSAHGYSRTFAGAVILAHHAIASGSIGDELRPLDGAIRVGGKHWAWEAKPWPEIKEKIDAAVESRCALTLMCHPSRMEASRSFWNEDLARKLIAYVRAQIDAGSLADISYYQSHHATVDAI